MKELFVNKGEEKSGMRSWKWKYFCFIFL